MSKALTVLKVFFSLVSINSTETPSSISTSSTGPSRSTLATTKGAPKIFHGTAYVGRAFRIPIPKRTLDAVNGDIFTMKTFNNGSIRSTSWVQFDTKRQEVYGFPLPGNAGAFFYKIFVTSFTGALVDEILFQLLVKANGFEYSHELVLTTPGTNFQQFMTRVNMRIDFAMKLARYCFNEKPESIWVKSFDKASRNLTLVFENIPYSPCNEDIYSKLRSKILHEETKEIQPNFQNALTERFPIQSARFRFFGACDPNLFGPEPPFEWGWLKHVIPIAILLCVVGIPVTISCLVNKYKRKPPVPQERRTPRTLRRNNVDGTTGLTSHTVHFNNRYPSLLSVSNNSKEDGVGEDEKGLVGKANIPNGSPSSKHLTIPNATGNRPRQGAATTADKTNNPTKQNNPFKFPYNREKGSFDVRAMWDDDDDDTERPPLNIPVYYTYRNNEEEEPSMLGAVLDMNFADIAENISSKLKGVKSMLNISQAETTEQGTAKPLGESSNDAPSLSSKLKGLGKSMLNLPAQTNEATGTTSSNVAPSLSSKLRDFGKSMLNISTNAQEDSIKKESENSKATYYDFEDSESNIYKPPEYEDARSERHRYNNARRGSDYTGDESFGYSKSTRRPSDISDYEDARSERQRYDHARRGSDLIRDDSIVYSHSRRRPSNISDYEDARSERQRYDKARRGSDFTEDDSFVYSQSFRRPSNTSENARSERQSYNDARRGSDDSSVYRQSTRLPSTTSEYELSQYLLARRHSLASDNHNRTQYQGRRHSTSSDYHQKTQDHSGSHHFNFGRNEQQGGRRPSRDSTSDDYPDSLFDAPSEHGFEEKSDHEKSIFDTDFDDNDEATPCLVKPKPIWNHGQVVKGRGGLGIESFPLKEIKYQDYTNPYQYSNGRVPRGKPSYSALRSNSYSSQSTLDFWDDDEYDIKTNWKQSSKTKDDFFASNLRRGAGKGGIPNGTMPQNRDKARKSNSLLPEVGSLFSRESRGARDMREKPPVVFTLGDDEEEERPQETETDNSMVGLIKTKVSGLLEPDGNVSRWLSGFNKSDNPVT